MIGYVGFWFGTETPSDSKTSSSQRVHKWIPSRTSTCDGEFSDVVLGNVFEGSKRRSRPVNKECIDSAKKAIDAKA